MAQSAEPLRALILGSSGMLGSDLVRWAPAGTIVQRGQLDGQRIDITDEAAMARALDELGPGVVINAAAYTKVDDAERNGQHAAAVNGAAVGALGSLCATRDIRVVHFSTDYVFPGTAVRPYRENDVVSPVNAYGGSKLLGERALEASGANALVLRAQWLFGLHGRSFPRTMWERAEARLSTRVVSDQYGRPTYTRDLAEATWVLVGRGTRGIFHVASAGEASWFELAQAVFAAAGGDSLVCPCGTRDYPTLARRPAYSVLDTSRFVNEVGHELPHWRDALERFLTELRGERQAA